MDDLYKADVIIPTAFDTAAWQTPSVERQMRIACRQKFQEAKLMQRILPDIVDVLDVGELPAALDDPAWDGESAAPGALWDPEDLAGPEGRVEGGVNYGSDDA